MTPTTPKASAPRREAPPADAPETISVEPAEAEGIDWETATEQGYVGEQPDDERDYTVEGVLAAQEDELIAQAQREGEEE
jgi:hypothetical protein